MDAKVDSNLGDDDPFHFKLGLLGRVVEWLMREPPVLVTSKRRRYEDAERILEVEYNYSLSDMEDAVYNGDEDAPYGHHESWVLDYLRYRQAMNIIVLELVCLRCKPRLPRDVRHFCIAPYLGRRKAPAPRYIPSFKDEIVSVLKQVHPDLDLCDEAAAWIEQFAVQMMQALISEAAPSERSLLDKESLRNAVRKIYGAELGKHGDSEGTKACYNGLEYRPGSQSHTMEPSLVPAPAPPLGPGRYAGE